MKNGASFFSRFDARLWHIWQKIWLLFEKIIWKHWTYSRDQDVPGRQVQAPGRLPSEQDPSPPCPVSVLGGERRGRGHPRQQDVSGAQLSPSTGDTERHRVHLLLPACAPGVVPLLRPRGHPGGRGRQAVAVPAQAGEHPAHGLLRLPAGAHGLRRWREGGRRVGRGRRGPRRREEEPPQGAAHLSWRRRRPKIPRTALAALAVLAQGHGPGAGGRRNRRQLALRELPHPLRDALSGQDDAVAVQGDGVDPAEALRRLGGVPG